MKIGILKTQEENESAPAPKKKSVVIATNLVRTKERHDIHGNVVDPRTKRIIRRAERE